MNIVIMITGSIVGVAYNWTFIAWYSGVEYEQYAFWIELQDHTGGRIGQWWLVMFFLHNLCGLKNWELVLCFHLLYLL
jgi:hypothetical protein